MKENGNNIASEGVKYCKITITPCEKPHHISDSIILYGNGLNPQKCKLILAKVLGRRKSHFKMSMEDIERFEVKE